MKLVVVKILSAVIMFLGGRCVCSAQIEGKWRDNENGAVIEVYRISSTYFGKLVAVDNEEDNEKIKGQTVMILKNFKKEGVGKWCCGTIFQPRLNVVADGVLQLTDTNTVKVTGTYLMLSQTVIWKRMKDGKKR